MPKLSVIVPVYNTQKYLPECIDSILAQTYTDFELILVDDGSADRSGVICEEYCRSDNRIRVIHQENGGVTAARKRGTEAAQGEYISFVDSDDWLQSDMYEQMLKYAERYDADMVLCDMMAERPAGSTVIHSSSLDGLFAFERLEQDICSNMLFDFTQNMPGLSLNLWNKIFRSDIMKPALLECPNQITYGEDALVSLICLLRSRRIYIMPESPFYHYRQGGEFLKREQKASLLPRLSDFALHTQRWFSELGFDGVDQLSGYTAQVSLYCVRQILLFNKEYSVKKKFALVRDHFAQPHIRALMERAEELVRDGKMRKKIKLVNKNRFLFLYGCFWVRELMQRFRSFCRSGRRREG